ncbi:active spliceosome conformation promoter CWC2 KNAG_0A02400 [Huiozyma naganishii CBS 8797]|uniref:Pre-mRNA-splicing factor CWC2 n=1 Tax=Huiozyma naganishii (strain ATCC MYA-139 / BCRC 22969 / CBS 8797 / KCTC 17520 / NBRC 10181 / NCYC 3082 / Yp74L-3) TaxID=1071383 RepID=J7S215_HUIN7|nr:hypothetical protein KNAG_0A02400 [Kazachstania naganishii CBS 8797]CCK67929.1 hypothetical protein KNAG_0A02400 [Kazachstania naganishii CBS 8797]
MAVYQWRDRRARRQVKEEELPSGLPPQSGVTFNVWYNKWSHGDSSRGSQRFVSPFRLDPARDSGRTRSSGDVDAQFCLFFARGCCVLGPQCTYLHHIPEDGAEGPRMPVRDCFGREKFSQYRDDMGGVGSFNNANRTLYIGGIAGALNDKPLKPLQIESRLRYLFNKLGALDRIRYVEAKNCAFVTFKSTANAEFAKEAMTNQTLLVPTDKEYPQRLEGSGLLVKWSHEDPDPEARARAQKQTHSNSLQLMNRILQDHAQGNDTTATKVRPRDADADGDTATHKRQKLVEYSSSSDDSDGA